MGRHSYPYKTARSRFRKRAGARAFRPAPERKEARGGKEEVLRWRSGAYVPLTRVLDGEAIDSELRDGRATTIFRAPVNYAVTLIKVSFAHACRNDGIVLPVLTNAVSLDCQRNSNAIVAPILE